MTTDTLKDGTMTTTTHQATEIAGRWIDDGDTITHDDSAWFDLPTTTTDGIRWDNGTVECWNVVTDARMGPGYASEGTFVIVDEITPDDDGDCGCTTCHDFKVWDAQS